MDGGPDELRVGCYLERGTIFGISDQAMRLERLKLSCESPHV